jgi:hypothetical protein
VGGEFLNPKIASEADPENGLKGLKRLKSLQHKRPVISPTASIGYFCEACKI